MPLKAAPNKPQWEIERSAKDAVSAISTAAKDAVSDLARAAQDARNALAASAADAAKVLVMKQADGGSDHDAIIKLASTVENLDKNVTANLNLMRTDIRDVGSDVASRMLALEQGKLNVRDSYPEKYRADVEKKLEALEASMADLSTHMTKILAYGSVAIFLLGIAMSLLRFWK